MLRLVRARYPSTDRTEIASPRVFSQRELGASSFVSRLAASHRPYRVSYRTDERFTSCCSPPRVTTTQLQADYKLRGLEEDFHLSDRVRSQAHWHGHSGHDRSRAGRPCHVAWGERPLARLASRPGPRSIRAGGPCCSAPRVSTPPLRLSTVSGENMNPFADLENRKSKLETRTQGVREAGDSAARKCSRCSTHAASSFRPACA